MYVLHYDCFKFVDRLKLTFRDRSIVQNPISKKLFEIMSSKEDNFMCGSRFNISNRFTKSGRTSWSPHMFMKTHIDIIEDFHPNVINHLKEIANHHNFLLFEDKKFGDIGKTVQLQYSKCIFQISSWPNLVTAHSLLGKGVLEGIKAGDGLKERGVFSKLQIDQLGLKSTNKLWTACEKRIN
jgi:uridine monophosphate synthetase